VPNPLLDLVGENVEVSFAENHVYEGRLADVLGPWLVLEGTKHQLYLHLTNVRAIVPLDREPEGKRVVPR